MDAKLNHSDLSTLLAKEAGITVAKSELLTKAFFDLIIEGLEQDGIVKINGLGTFKLMDVASRSSVNVNTGEKFEIKGHRKLTFTPADALKDCVNQPFAMFEPVEVDETYKDDVEEENCEPVTEDNTTEEVVLEETPMAVTATETAVENLQENETIIEEKQAEPKVEQPIEPQKRPEPVMVHVPKKEKKPFAVPEKKEKKKRTWLYVVFAVLFMLAAVAVLFILHITPVVTDDATIDTVTRIEYKTDDATGAKVVEETVTKSVSTTDALTGATVVENTVTKAEYKPDAVTEATVDATSAATPQDKVLVTNEESLTSLVQTPSEPEEYKFVITDALASLDLKKITSADTTLYDIVGVWAEHKVIAHETLTRIALKYYGDKRLWPYIVKYNSMSRPDDLSKGMKILVPKLKPRK